MNWFLRLCEEFYLNVFGFWRLWTNFNFSKAQSWKTLNFRAVGRFLSKFAARVERYTNKRQKQSRNFWKIARDVINFSLGLSPWIWCVWRNIVFTLPVTPREPVQKREYTILIASEHPAKKRIVSLSCMKRVASLPPTLRQNPIVSRGTYQPSAIKWKCARRRCAICHRCNSATRMVEP